MKSLIIILLSFVIINKVFAQLPWELAYNGSNGSSYMRIGSSTNGTVYGQMIDMYYTPILVISKSDGAPGTWTKVSMPPVLASLQDITFRAAFNGPNIYVVTSSSMWWSGDYGNNWQNWTNVPFSIVGGAYFNFLPWGNIILSNRPGGILYRSVDQGQTWTTSLNSEVKKIIHRHAETYAFTNTAVYKSTDLGTTWMNINAVLPANDWRNVALLSSDSFITVRNQDVFISSDAITWHLKPSSGLHSEPVDCNSLVSVPTSDSLFILRDASANMPAEILCSPNGGSQWISFDAGAGNVADPVINTLYLSHNGYLFASGIAGDVFRIPKRYAMTASSIEVPENVLKIYPNPATEQITIEGVEVGSRVSIVNMLGQDAYNGVINDNREIISVGDFAQGNYIVQLTGVDGKRQIIKLVKQ